MAVWDLSRAGSSALKMWSAPWSSSSVVLGFLYWDPKAGDDLLGMADGVVVADRPVPMLFYISGLSSGFTATSADLSPDYTPTGKRQGWASAVILQYQGHRIVVSVSLLAGGPRTQTMSSDGVARACSVDHDIEICVLSRTPTKQKVPAFATLSGLQGILRPVHRSAPTRPTGPPTSCDDCHGRGPSSAAVCAGTVPPWGWIEETTARWLRVLGAPAGAEAAEIVAAARREIGADG
jgi:hypothetical protein